MRMDKSTGKTHGKYFNLMSLCIAPPGWIALGALTFLSASTAHADATCIAGDCGSTPRNRPPRVRILSPEDNVSLKSGCGATFTGWAQDFRDPEAKLRYLWTATPGGEMSGKVTFDEELVTLESPAALPPGEVVVTLVVSDTQGATASDSVLLEVSGTDLDCDGYDAVAEGGDDCDDSDPEVHPGMAEVCHNEKDDNCSGDSDDCRFEGVISLAAASAKIVGEASKDEFGSFNFIGGDLNDDGFADLVIGASKNDHADDMAGSLYVFYGPLESGVHFASDADAARWGEAAGDHVVRPSSGGDINGDGYSDIAAGAYAHGEYDEGAACVLLGPLEGKASLSEADFIIQGEEEEAESGRRSVFAGDIDGDGIDDLLVGVMGDSEGGIEAGAVYVFYGPLDAPELQLADADAKVIGADAGDQACYPAPAGDVNGDGIDDFLVGAPGADAELSRDNGAAYLIAGPVAGAVDLSDESAYLAKFVGEEAMDRAGGTHLGVAPAGDVNGDGNPDILVGAHWAGVKDRGAAYLFYGPFSGVHPVETADAIFRGEDENDKLGYCISTAGDLDGDSYDDVLISALGRDRFTGTTYLFYGPLSGDIVPSLDRDAEFKGEGVGDYSGGFTFDAGDVDGDGRSDILIGAGVYDHVTEEETIEDVGAAYLIHASASQ